MGATGDVGANVALAMPFAGPRGTSWSGRSGRRPRDPNRPAPVVIGVFLAAISVAALLLPAGAASPSATVTYRAPYSTATVSSATGYSVAGCSHLSLAKARWNSTSGVGNFSARGTALSCAPGPSGTVPLSSIIVTGRNRITLPVTLPTGSTSALVKVGLSWNATSAFQSHLVWSCPPAVANKSVETISSCTGNVRLALMFTAVMVNVRTGQQLSGISSLGEYVENSSLYSNDYCDQGYCQWSNYSFQFAYGELNTSQNSSIAASFAPGNGYGVELTATEFVQVSLIGFASSKMIGALNVGTQGQSWDLQWVSVV